MRGNSRSFGHLWPPFSLAWVFTCLGLCLSLFNLQAETATSPHSRFEHSNGVWQSWPLTKAEGSTPRFYLLDRGSLLLARDAAEKIQETAVNYTLGVRPNADKVLELDLSERWQRSINRHQLALNIQGNSRTYQGSSQFASLENQFLLNAGKGLAVPSRDSQDLGGQLSLEDRIALSHNLDLTLSGSQFEQRVSAEGFQKFSTQLGTGTLNLEQRWSRGSLAASLQNSTLRVAGDTGQGLPAAKGKQILNDAQLNIRIPIASRLDVATGWQDLRSEGENQQNPRYLRGPSLGLIYGPYAAWSGQVLLRSLSAKGDYDSKANTFGQVSLAWQRDSSNELTLSWSKQIDLLAEFRSAKDLKIPVIDQQQSSVTSFLQWNHQANRHLFSLSSNTNRQIFTLSRNEMQSIETTYTYNLSRLADVTSSLSLTRTTLESFGGLGSSTRLASAWLLAWQQQMPGGLSPLGGHSFWRVEGDWQSLQENLLDLQARRLSLLLSLGQQGNF